MTLAGSEVPMEEGRFEKDKDGLTKEDRIAHECA
jgi:hypothetical protein